MRALCFGQPSESEVFQRPHGCVLDVCTAYYRVAAWIFRPQADMREGVRLAIGAGTNSDFPAMHSILNAWRQVQF